ncbi:MAG: 5'/3'-nucleotidase SurE, partial [Halobacteriaceae archaeon]
MSSLPRILLTNDDGIQATGLASVKDALSTVADVTVIAPQLNQSGSSRSNSRQFDVEKHDEGYAVAGTPVDCVHFGYGYLDKDFDIVVSGCNDAPNIGAHKIERSGTVGAAIEAGFLGLPGLALSLYDHPDGTRDFSRDDYSEAQKTAKFLVSQLDRQSIPEAFDYFNVNIPASPPDPPLRITEPVFHFDIRVDETAN